jgi:sulfate/thiosulfate transport system ATP-binding protein
MSIVIEQIHKSYGDFKALNGVSLTIENSELVALLGPSGSGKTTLLRIIAGLEPPDSGAIRLHDEEATNLNAARRGIGFVFQHYALFRHMTIFENIAFGVRVQRGRLRPSQREIQARVKELLSLIQLESYARMYPDQLSGGQRQRVALARALAVRPRVLLLDEPFSALDAKIRKDLRNWLRHVHDELRVTTVLVTHDHEEALEVADRVAILKNGALEQFGTPQEIYDNPVSPFVYNFLGNVNLFHGRLLADLSPAVGSVPPGESTASTIGFVRPHEFEVFRVPPEGRRVLTATIERVHAAGSQACLDVKVSELSNMVAVEVSKEQFRDLELAEGQRIFLSPQAIRVFNDQAATEQLLELGAGI